jgi:hypothetical protein
MPVAPIVCVRAGMGPGKSESVKDLLQEHYAEGEDDARVDGDVQLRSLTRRITISTSSSTTRDEQC